MRKMILTAAVVAAAAGVASAQTLDDLSIGTLFPGDVVTGDTSTSSNDMNGSSIGGTTTGWFGGDDVYTVIWNGGDFVADLFFTHADGDLDLWLINDPAAGFANVVDSSLSTTDNEQVTAANLAAGTYYLVIDGWQGASNTYTLAVIPAPGALALLGLGGLAAARRRR